MANAVSPTHNGWSWDKVNGRLYAYYRGTAVFYITASSIVYLQTYSITGGLTTTTTIAATTSIAATTTMTAGTGLTVTTGNLTVTAGDERITAGNLRLGAVSAFATTEPTSAAVFKQGTAFAGAITTSGGIMSNGTVVRKIIAAGTVSNVET